MKEYYIVGRGHWSLIGWSKRHARNSAVKVGPSDRVVCLRSWHWWRDIWFSYRIAKDPSVRAQSLDESPPTLRKHLRWVWKLIGVNKFHAYVVEDFEGAKVGQVRYDWDHENKQSELSDTLNWEVGIALVPRARGKGLGTWALNATAPDSFPIIATIKWSNRASLKAFERADYKLNSELSDTKLAKMVRVAQ